MFQALLQKLRPETATPPVPAEPDPLFGVLKYSSQNIGDEIQSLAAMRFLPHVDYYCHRERLDNFRVKEEDAGQKVKLIMNAWWIWEPKHFPPSGDIDPLLISMYFNPRAREDMKAQKNLDYFRAHGPVGCRDMSTKRFFDEQDVPAYFSGCLTMTLLPNPVFREKNKHDYILCVDLPEYLVEEVKKRTNRPVYNVSRMLSVAFSAVDRMTLAKVMLSLYHNAHCVVSSRLHVSLPATAFGTPLCMIQLESEDRQGRFDGMENFFHQFTEAEFLQNPHIYDFDNPPKNPENHIALRDNLVQTVSAFTGYDSKTSLFEDDYDPLIDVIRLLHMSLDQDRDVLNRVLIFATKNELLEALYKKQIDKKSKYDLQI